MTEASHIIGQGARAACDVARGRLRARLGRAPFVLKGCAAAALVYFALASLIGDVAEARGLTLAAALAGSASVGMLWRVRWGRLGRVVRRRFARPAYDERSILADLSDAGRAVTTRRQLFETAVGKIRQALDPACVSIFVRDDETGAYLCEILSAANSVGEAEAARESRAPSRALAADAFVVRRLGRLSMPLTVGAQDYDSWARSLAASKREARRRERETLEGVGASLLLPVMMKDELSGVMALGARRCGAPYAAEDKRLLLAIAGQLAFVIENTKLAARIVEEERLRRELAMASEVQRRLFPECPPESEWLELSGSCTPARGVGGDYYDFLALDEHLTGVAVADVAGKGISAALLMSVVQASLRSQAAAARKGGSLAELASTMNQLMYASTGSSSYATFFYAQFDARTRRLTYVNAGHNPPLLRRAGETRASIERLSTGGPVIGVLDGCGYEQESVEVSSGDVLLAYTDGLTEALNPEGEEFGEERLIQILDASAHLQADAQRETILRRVNEWSASAPQHDDLTILVLKVK